MATRPAQPTDIEKIHPGAIASSIKVIPKETAFLESQLGQIVSAIISEQDGSSWPKKLSQGHCHYQRNEAWPFAGVTHGVDIGDGLRPIVRMEGA